MFAFVAEGNVVSLIVRAVGRGEQLTVGVKSGDDVLWTTTMAFDAGEVADDGKVKSAVVGGVEVSVGARVKVAGAIAFYTPRNGDGKQRNKAFNLTKVAVMKPSGDGVDSLLGDLAF